MLKMKNKKIILIVLIILGLLAGFFAYRNINPRFSSPYVGGKFGVGPKLEAGVNFTDNIPGQISVYDFMAQLQKNGRINFIEKNYPGLGEFIDSINGIKNGGSRAWIYYVNDVEAQVGVSNYKLKMGDTLSWKYEKSY